MKNVFYDPRRDDSNPHEGRAEAYYDQEPASQPMEHGIYIAGAEGEDEAERRGCSWLLVFVMLAILGVIALVYWGANRMYYTMLVQPSPINYGMVSMLPSGRIQTPSPDLQLQIYYIAGGRALAPETRRLRKPATENERLRLITQELMQPPAGKLLENPLPGGTTIRGAYLLNNIAYVDLSIEFTKVDRPTPLRERLAIYALVNSIMLNNRSIQGVQIMIDGRPAATAWGWIDLTSPLGPDLALETPANEPGQMP